MVHFAIQDWDSAYNNMDNIPDGAAYPARWAADAAGFRAQARMQADIAYGDGSRDRFDLFLPEADPLGLLVFVHGGYWMKFDKSYWSHFSVGALGRGFAVAMPSYPLCPDVRLRDIANHVARAVEAAASKVAGPIVLAGHSAGGHLVSTLASEASTLDDPVRKRIIHVMSISGVHDLRPLLKTRLNETLRIDSQEAVAASPALLSPHEGVRLTCWVGAGERAEFLRQNALLANVWHGLGAATSCVESPDHHHFNVLDGLLSPVNAMVAALLKI